MLTPAVVPKGFTPGLTCVGSQLQTPLIYEADVLGYAYPLMVSVVQPEFGAPGMLRVTVSPLKLLL